MPEGSRISHKNTKYTKLHRGGHINTIKKNKKNTKRTSYERGM